MRPARLRIGCAGMALHLGADGSAGLKGFDQVPVLNKAFDIVTMPALMLPLCIGKDDHENQGH